MRHRMINKKFTLSWVYSLLMVIFSTAVADSNQSQYSLQLTAGQSNPWAIPQQPPEKYQNFQQPNTYQNQQYQGQQYQNQQHQDLRPRNDTDNRRRQSQPGQNRIYQGNRFVTEEFLETLNRQQSQMQVMPENRRYHPNTPRQAAPQQPKSNMPGQGVYGNPSYGTGYVDPLVDTLSDVPVVTPWTPWDIGISDW